MPKIRNNVMLAVFPIVHGKNPVQRCGNNGEYSARYFRERKAEEGGDVVHR